jgi:predicted metal-dependent hydrolase
MQYLPEITTCIRKARFAYPSASGTHGANGFAYMMRKVFNLLKYLLPTYEHFF